MRAGRQAVAPGVQATRDQLKSWESALGSFAEGADFAVDWSTGVVNFAEDAHAVANNLQMVGGVGALVTTGAQLVAKRACTEFIKLTAKAVAGIAASNAIGALTDSAVKLAQLLGVTVDPCYLRAACEGLQVVSLWKAARSLRKAADAQCFVAGTEVLVGSVAQPGVFAEKRIEDVRVGDLVWAKDQHDPDAPLELRRVTRTFSHRATDLQTLRVRDDAGNVETLRVTDEHPFYVDGLGWTGAAELRVGQRLVSPDGLTLTVDGNVDERHVGGVMVYNFEVEGAHTYFVADGVGPDSFVWAHNRCFGDQNPKVDAPGQLTGEAASSWVLRKNLEKAGVVSPGGDAAHHMVAGGDPRAALTRARLQSEGIDINGAANGVFLPRHGGVAAPPAITHTNVHTNRYYEEVESRVTAAAPGTLPSVLAQIRRELLDGTFPY